MKRMASALVVCATLALFGCQDATNGVDSSDNDTPAEFKGLTLVTLKVPNMT